MNLNITQLRRLCRWAYEHGLNEGWEFEDKLNEKILRLKHEK